MFVILIVLGFLCLLILTLQQANWHPAGANLDQAMSFPLPGVAEALAQREDIPLADAQRLEREFRRWFAVVSASHVRIGMGSRQVDAFWHVLLERQELYESFSQAVAGRVVAHIEGIGGEVLEARSWVAYESLWGEEPPADLWPRPPDRALRRVRASARRRTGSDDGGDPTAFILFAGSDGGQAGHHHGGDHGGGHGHGSCAGGQGCGGGH